MADAEVRKIRKWADTGDRTDPDDTSLTPALTRADGWPQSFSDDPGNTPRRRVLNQLLREITGIAVEDRDYGGGPFPYDPLIDYRRYARCAIGVVEYVALVANGPVLGNATDPSTVGQAVWQVSSGEVGAPSAPRRPSSDAGGSGTVTWQWNCPLDGGAEVTEFQLQWRGAGESTWPNSVTVPHPRYVLSGIDPGGTIEVRVRARNMVGYGGWSPTADASAIGTVPGGGNQFGLTALAGNGQASLDWSAPNNGGLEITGYTVRWRAATQDFSSARQSVATETGATVSGLVNGTVYYFDVSATNSLGDGPPSSEASATPFHVPPLVLAQGAVSLIASGAAVYTTLSAATGGVEPKTYSLTGQPAGIAFNPSTRRLSAAADLSGSANLTYTAVDDSGASVSTSVPLTYDTTTQLPVANLNGQTTSSGLYEPNPPPGNILHGGPIVVGGRGGATWDPGSGSVYDVLSNNEEPTLTGPATIDESLVRSDNLGVRVLLTVDSGASVGDEITVTFDVSVQGNGTTARNGTADSLGSITETIIVS